MTREFVDTVNKFGFQLQALAVQNEGPSGLCPLNIYHCLAMVAAGSKDKNLKAFGHVMGFNVDKSEPSVLKEQLAQVVRLDSYSKGNTAVDFSSANSIWHSADFVPNAPWLSTMKDTFQATVEPLALDAMNAFIERETRGKFKDLIKPDDLVGAVLYLVSCLYFKAKVMALFLFFSQEYEFLHQGI
jgi:serine protease inhibitor